MSKRIFRCSLIALQGHFFKSVWEIKAWIILTFTNDLNLLQYLRLFKAAEMDQLPAHLWIIDYFSL